jgi:hypothetical protein
MEDDVIPRGGPLADMSMCSPTTASVDIERAGRC